MQLEILIITNIQFFYAENNLFQNNEVNTLAVVSKEPSVAKASVAMVSVAHDV